MVFWNKCHTFIRWKIPKQMLSWYYWSIVYFLLTPQVHSHEIYKKKIGVSWILKNHDGRDKNTLSSFVFVTFVWKIIKPFKFSTYIVPLFESWRKNQKKKLITIFHYWALYYLRWKDGIQLELLNFNASKVKRRNLVKKTVYMWC